MLSKKLHEALNAQINAEMWSAYLYLSMSMDAEATGLKGLANWFYVQFSEAQDLSLTPICTGRRSYGLRSRCSPLRSQHNSYRW